MADKDILATIVQQQTQLLQEMQRQLMLLSKPDLNINVPWPSPLNINICPEEAFKTFEASWTNYCRATQMDSWPLDQEARKVSILFSALGEEALKKYGYFGVSQADKESKSSLDLLKIISSKLVPKKNIIYNRYMFLSRNQQQNESFDIYYSDITRLIEDCNYKDFKDEMLRDKIVIGISDMAIKKELLKKDNLSLNEAINLCRAAEATEIQIKNLASTSTSVSTEIKKIEEKTKKEKKGRCRFCGNNHIFKKEICPAWGKTCTHCKGRNHLDKVCNKKKEIKELKEEIEPSYNSDSDSEIQIINRILDKNNLNLAECKMEYKKEGSWYETICLLDTAADESLIGYKNLEEMFGKEYIQNRMKPSKKNLFSFGGHSIMIHGEINIILRVKISNNISKYNVIFQVVHNKHIPLLSCKACTEMGLVKFCKEVKCNYSQQTNDIIKKYDKVFNGRGSFTGELDLEINENIPPVIQKARRVPVSLRPMLKEELKRLEEEGVIVKEESHTDWVSNILIIKKKDAFRICLDPIPLNKAIKRPNHQFTTVEEILPELGRARVFSTFDVRKGFWHLNLSEKSSRLTTFWTPFGKYRWKVLPFGISSAPDYFQIKMSEMIQGLNGVEALVDDLLVYGVGDSMPEAIKDHNKNLENLMQRLIRFNCKLNKEKTKLLQTSVKYYGHIFTNKGLQPDPSKIEAVMNIPSPQNKKELQRFLGVVTYLSRFIPNLSAESSYLRELTHEKTEWVWNKRAKKEFEQLKSLISDIKTLKYYDKNETLIVECDSSEGALGVALFQQNQPVAYASRRLTPTERKYAQIEKELLAVVFACTRFDQLIVGNLKTVIKTDHKPLLNIFKKPLLHAPKRLQSMLLILQRYSLELQFVSGKENIMADALSRFYLECKDIDKSKNLKIFKILEKVNPIQTLPISDNCIKEIEKATSEDTNFTILKKYILQGWPKYATNIPDALKPYSSLKEDLTIYEGLILKGKCIIIPESIRVEMLKKLHKAHSGIENTIKLARDAIFWPSMSKDIKEMIKSCSVCIKYQPSQQKLPMKSHKIPDYPFQIISMDVFFFTQRGCQMKFLITVDHYSDFFEIDKLKDMSARSVIEACKKNFSRHGIPEIVVTDGGTNFVNQEFAEFAQSWNFTQVTSSPNHPQGNGKAEATVKIAKRLLLKSNEDREDFWLNLLCLRNTPNKLNSSPVQRLYSRRTRGCLPFIQEMLKPEIVQNVPLDIINKREIVKQSYDKRSRRGTTLEIGQPVAVQIQPSVNKSWTAGVITDALSDRSYLVNVNDATYRRDISHIRPIDYTNNYDLNITQNDLPAEVPQDIVNQMSYTAQNNVQQMSSNAFHQMTPTAAPSASSPEKYHRSVTADPEVPSLVASTNIQSVPAREALISDPRPKRNTRKPAYLNDYAC